MSFEPGKLLVVEDDAALRELLVQELSDRGYETAAAGDTAAALHALRQKHVDLVISDIRLPGGSGFDLLDALRDDATPPAIIMITAFGSVPQAVEALKAGADDFLTKPLDLDHLGVRVERVLANRRTGATLAALQENLRRSNGGGGFHGMVGDSAPMRRLFDAVRHVAGVDEPVLVVGESGTGKELVARAIHAESARSSGPFVAINCASIPEPLMEAEFFGHSAGAFTGASSARKGLFREADGGVLFLDEIGEMPAAMQAKFLRVLQDGWVRPLGGGEPRQVDVRIVAATNLDIEEAVRHGNWRQDLFYRLEALSLHVPPLRERAEDLWKLAAHFLEQIALERNREKLVLGERAMDALAAYSFPGNVRELANALIRAATFCEGPEIDARHLPERMRLASRSTVPGDDPLRVTRDPAPSLEEIERRYIDFVLDSVGHNKLRAAEILGIGRRTLYRKLERGGLPAASGRHESEG